MLHQNRLVLISILSLPLAGCATFGTNISGDFSCDAPKGRCAPTHTIDDEAISEIADDERESQIPAFQQSTHIIADSSVSGQPRRVGQRVLKIVFPSRVDARGRLHEARTVHAVVDKGLWVSPPRELGSLTLAEPQERAADDIEGPDITAAQSTAAALTDDKIISRASLKAEAETKLKGRAAALPAPTAPSFFAGYEETVND